MAFLCGLVSVCSGPPTMAQGHAPADEGCIACHGRDYRDLGDHHRFAQRPCTACHEGIGDAPAAEAAHKGLHPSPGQLDNMVQTCGGCHPRQAQGVLHGPMHRGTDMVTTTRAIIDGNETDHATAPDLQHLGDTAADTLLRKLCASCHLGQPMRSGTRSATFDRGGGCLACHLNRRPESAHSSLTTKVEDGRCFGCHSRSGRIALSYAGLAEVDEPSPFDAVFQMEDGRKVARRPSDRHHSAGMACIDCHTGYGLMGLIEDTSDIACDDCHENNRPRLALRDWEVGYAALKKRIPFEATPDQPFLTTRNGTPLWHIQILNDDLVLHRKLDGKRLKIPRVSSDHMPLTTEHERLTCDACHTQWAPQCYGCHLAYDPEDAQWDHLIREITPGAWREYRWDVRSNMAPLGLDKNGKIRPFVPGMIMTLDHPDLERASFVRRFAPLSAHTTGPSHACDDCHGNPVALGLGLGRFVYSPSQLTIEFESHRKKLPDGLPADAWTDLTGAHDKWPTGARPFSSAEIRRLSERQRAKP